MKNIIIQNTNTTNANNLQGAESQPLGLYELATHSNLINIIKEVQDMEFAIDWEYHKNLDVMKKKKAVISKNAIELYIEWDVFEFGRIMGNASPDQIYFRELVLSIVFMFSFQICIDNNEETITYIHMAETLKRVVSYFNEIKVWEV